MSCNCPERIEKIISHGKKIEKFEYLNQNIFNKNQFSADYRFREVGKKVFKKAFVAFTHCGFCGKKV